MMYFTPLVKALATVADERGEAVRPSPVQLAA
jgi:hypothetical protein